MHGAGSLTYFSLFPIEIPSEHEETFGFLIFPRESTREHEKEMG